MKRLLLLTQLLCALAGSLPAQDSIPAQRLPGFYDPALQNTMRSFGDKDLKYVAVYKKGRVWRSTLTGLCIGAGIGAIIGFASGNDPKDQWFSFTAGQKALGLGILGGTVGTIAGLIVGLATHKTKKTRH